MAKAIRIFVHGLALSNLLGSEEVMAVDQNEMLRTIQTLKKMKQNAVTWKDDVTIQEVATKVFNWTKSTPQQTGTIEEQLKQKSEEFNKS